ncbi:testis-expressed protein 9 [Drosophila willistoni]|uniref:testis-expressed protein 9 n=1 Tax=Drosophila willistoni TaxID=7260 RepID=UPI001F081AC6|nr:testis-expressed protein 9 [Drosophila willistoni]
MAELLSREKELFKINQELNLMTLNSSGTTAENVYPANNMNNNTSLPRYGTYHKQKGPSTLLKKKGQASAFQQPKAKTTVAVPPAKTKGGGGGEVPSMPTTPRATTLLTKSKGPEWRQGTAGTVPTTTTMTAATATTGTHILSNSQKYATAPPGATSSIFESKYSTYTRGTTSKTAAVIKYRNPNFSESPSLDQLLRNDLADAANVVKLVEVSQKRESTTVVSGQSKKQLTQDNFIKFLKAKVAILEEDHAQHATEMARQKEQLDQALNAQQKAESHRDQALSTNKHLMEQLQRSEQQCEDSNRRQKDRQQEYTNQQRELELLRRDAKILKQTVTNLENRLGRAHEEAENARQALNQMRGEQREQQETSRKELKTRDNRIKALKRQRGDLLNAYKKQLFMIDNLKRQTACMEQSVAIGFGEKEFNKVLEWNAKT